MSLCEYSDRVEGDLEDISDYIGGHSVRAADRIIRQILDKTLLLAKQPKLYRERPEIVLGIRLCPYRRYVIAYRTVAGGIRVERVLHGARDVSGILADGTPDLGA